MVSFLAEVTIIFTKQYYTARTHLDGFVKQTSLSALPSGKKYRPKMKTKTKKKHGKPKTDAPPELPDQQQTINHRTSMVPSNRENTKPDAPPKLPERQRNNITPHLDSLIKQSSVHSTQKSLVITENTKTDDRRPNYPNSNKLLPYRTPHLDGFVEQSPVADNETADKEYDRVGHVRSRGPKGVHRLLHPGGNATARVEGHH